MWATEHKSVAGAGTITPCPYCPVVRGEDEVRRIQDMLRYTLSNPEDVPKAGNACTTVIKTAGHPPA